MLVNYPLARPTAPNPEQFCFLHGPWDAASRQNIEVNPMISVDTLASDMPHMCLPKGPGGPKAPRRTNGRMPGKHLQSLCTNNTYVHIDIHIHIYTHTRTYIYMYL